MSEFDFLWDYSQEFRIEKLREGLVKAQTRNSHSMAQMAKMLGLMQKENDELRLRFAVLLRTLIQQNTITQAQFETALAEAKATLEKNRIKMAGQPKQTKPIVRAVARKRGPGQ